MEVICLTTSAGECRSINRLWILQHNHRRNTLSRAWAYSIVSNQACTWTTHSTMSEGCGPHLISKRSHVLVPSPQGDFLVVMCSTLVGMRTGPFTFSCLSLAPRIRSEQTAQVNNRELLKQSGAVSVLTANTSSSYNAGMMVPGDVAYPSPDSSRCVKSR